MRPTTLQTSNAAEPRAAPSCPEQELFLAVVCAALQDLSGRRVGCDKANTNALWRTQAESWIFAPANKEDFEKVCDFAAVDPDYVRSLARRIVSVQ